MLKPWDLERGSDPFNVTLTGYLGRQRESMLTNELLQKSRIGTAKTRGHQIPKDVVFCNTYRSPWKMSHALTGWSGLLPSLGPKVPKDDEKGMIQKDFMQLNRAALTKGIVTCPDTTSYRKTHGPVTISLVPGKATKNNILHERPPPKSFHKDTIFGKVGEIGPPINTVITHEYQNCWIQDMKKKKKEPVEPVKEPPRNPKSVKTNLTTQRRMFMAPTGVQSQPWRMKKFLNKAKPHLSTFRSDRELCAAWAANEFESQGRQGQTGQGAQRVKVHEHPLPPIKAAELCPPHVMCKSGKFRGFDFM